MSVKLKLKITVPDDWHLGSMNDGLFIIDQPPRPSTDDVVPDGPRGPELVIPISGLDMDKALKITLAHNAVVTSWRDLYMRYLGVLKLLEEASPYVPEEVRDQIIMAHQHAVESHPDRLQHKVMLHRSCIEVKT